MKNLVQSGDVIDCIAPTGGVVSGRGVLIGTHMFGVAAMTAAQTEPFPLQTVGVVEIAKTSALAITAGDALYWDDAAKVVNRTATAQKLVGYAIAGAVNPSATVLCKLLPNGFAAGYAAG